MLLTPIKKKINIPYKVKLYLHILLDKCYQDK